MSETHVELKQTGRGWEAPLSLLSLQEGFNVRENAEPDEELQKSVETHGVLRPLHIRKDPDAPGKFFVIDGERRFRAAQKAKKKSVPVINEGDLDDTLALVMSLVTNEGAKPFTAKETANAFLRLRKAEISDAEIARVMGYSSRKVKETLRALESGDEALATGVASDNPAEKIPPRVAARAADLPKEDREKVVPMLKGKSAREGLKAVRGVEKERGIQRRGRQATDYPWARDAKNRAEILEKAAKAMIKAGTNRKAEAHLDIIQVLKGKKEPGELYVELLEKEKEEVKKSPTAKKVAKKAAKKTKAAKATKVARPVLTMKRKATRKSKAA